METNPSFPRVFIHPRYTTTPTGKNSRLEERKCRETRPRWPPSLAIVARRRTTIRRQILLVQIKIVSANCYTFIRYIFITSIFVLGRSRNRAETDHPFLFLPPLQHPVYPESTKALVASMLLLFQHSHYVSADSKSLLYLFFALWYFFFFTLLFLIIIIIIIIYYLFIYLFFFVR